jgi:uncharacterized circularly permuted ATP-grasp superfamily protein
MIPRIITAAEWRKLSRGIEQRVRALNAFLHDLYHRQEIVRAGRLPERLLRDNDAFLRRWRASPRRAGSTPTWSVSTSSHRTRRLHGPRGQCPHAVGRVLHAREPRDDDGDVPGAVHAGSGRPVSDYPRRLARSLAAARRPPAGTARGRGADPGHPQLAYFEHAFLADQMGAELVEGGDLRVVDGRIAMRTTRGYSAVDVLYRRVDDDYLDPLTFKPDSALGVAGIMDVYRAGGITIANAPGTGIADDKAIYSFMPEIVEFYTGEKPLLANVPTWRCAEADGLAYVSTT